MKNIRKATFADLSRIAEIVVFNYRLNFYPIFKNDDYYFDKLQVPVLISQYEAFVDEIWVYDDGVIKGFIQISGKEIRKLFVEPVLQSKGIGSALLNYAIAMHDAHTLWTLEKNDRAIQFYGRHGFQKSIDRKPEADTTEFLVRLFR